MEHLDLINNFFSHIRCSNCQEFFKEGSVQLIRKETNNIVVKITCTNCDKNLGLAILGIDNAEYKNSLDFSNQEAEAPVCADNSSTPITYDDVIEAHNFFANLGDDWAKHLPSAE